MNVEYVETNCGHKIEFIKYIW